MLERGGVSILSVENCPYQWLLLIEEVESNRRVRHSHFSCKSDISSLKQCLAS